MQKKVFLFLAIICIFAVCFEIFSSRNKDPRIELNLWTIQLKPVAADIIEENIATFEKKFPKYKVVWVDIPIAEAQKRTLASILGGNPPDLINLNPDFSVILAQIGALEFFSKEETKDFIPSGVEMLKYKGESFALPFYATSSITLFNKEKYENCNFKNPPSTYDELISIAPKLKSCSGIYPLAINLNENDSFAKILNKYGIYKTDNEKDIQKTYEIFKMFDDLYKKNLISKDTLTINHREMAEKYMSGNAMFVVIGSNFLNMIKENAPEIYSKSDVSKQLTSNNGKYDVALMNFVIPKRAKNKEMAKELAKIITSSESQIALSKLTNIIPTNKIALDDPYFKNCNSNLNTKARCISIEQLKNIQNRDFGSHNKKQINEAINKTVETVLLESKNSDDIHLKVREMSDTINYLMNN